MPFYAFLAKKVAIPDGKRVRVLSWDPEGGWLASGGDDGMLKVLKLELDESLEATTHARGVTAATKLSINQPLEGHQSA